ncbi:MAG: aminotransferase class I/II-fold pyridoxal phosphate-dependent enzyme [Christensenellales bacterium]
MNKIIEESEKELEKLFKQIDNIALENERKVLNSFKKSRIALEHMYGSSGYGYSDIGKIKLNELFANIFNAESAICSPLITCGTHALGASLMGIVKSGDKILSITGDVYDSLLPCVNKKGIGSLYDYGVEYKAVELNNGKFDYDAIVQYMTKINPNVIYIQRSCGYSTRDTFSIDELAEAIKFVKQINKEVIVFVDNCYGTFSSTKEPTDIGADIVVGSLIKNAGGGIAPTGGYVAGKKELVDRIAGRLFGVGLGAEVGSYVAGYQNYFEGVFIAPSVVKNALKGSLLIGKVLEKFGIKSYPNVHCIPNDIIRRIDFNDKNKMIEFIRRVQFSSPVDSFVSPEPSYMPGYEDDVIMASGGFVQGASIEMSCDGPIRPPYTAYFQGGLTYEQVKIFAEDVANYLDSLNKN